MKQLGVTLTKMYCLLGRKSEHSTSKKLLIYKPTEAKQDLRNTTLGYGLHFTT
jgi:hypothetical protein